MPRQGKYPDELRERAVRMVLDHEGEYASRAAICSVAEMLGPKAETVRLWVRGFAQVIRDEHGAVICHEGSIEDFTDLPASSLAPLPSPLRGGQTGLVPIGDPRGRASSFSAWGGADGVGVGCR